MKTLMKSSIAILALLTSSFAYAQEKTFTFEELQQGDSVMIRKSEVTHYLTGEEPSTWVYGNKFEVRQKGSKRFPEGIMLMPILSWIGAEYLYLPDEEEQANGGKESAAAAAQQGKSNTDNAAAAQDGQQAGAAGGKKAPQGGQQDNAAEGAAASGDNAAQGGAAASGENAAQGGAAGSGDNAAQGGAAGSGENANAGNAENTENPENVDNAEGTQKAQGGVVYKPENPEMVQKDSKTNGFHRFSIGVRAGAASLMHNNEVNTMGNWKLGFDALLDLQYAYYFGHRADKKISHGILTGLSVGYSSSPISNAINNDYQITGDDGEKIDYHIEATRVSEQDGQVQIEVPLMYSMLMDNGFFLNIGPKFMMPVFTHYNQTLTDPHVSAYFEDMGVTVKDEVITGYVQDGDLNTKGNWGKTKTKISIMITAELGYEWKLNNGNSLGLGVYANYAPFNTFKNDTENVSLIQVEKPSGSTPAGAAEVLAATDTYTKGMNYFDGGLKLVYHFNFPVYKK